MPHGQSLTTECSCVKVWTQSAHVQMVLVPFSHRFLYCYRNPSQRCGHCTSFAPSYSEIARHFHSNPELGVKVGKIDTSVEKALAQRFGFQYLPAFFLISGSSVYGYDDDRTKASLIEFATSGYKQQAVCECVVERDLMSTTVQHQPPEIS